MAASSSKADVQLSKSSWRSLECPETELCLDLVLACGQSFRWQPAPAHGSEPCAWTGVIGSHLVSLQRPNSNVIEWTVHHAETAAAVVTDAVLVERVKDYLALGVRVGDLYRQWSEADKQFVKVASAFQGIRILRQDPLETLFAFICSSNNHISRISGMVQRLCALFGEYLATVGGHDFYKFPTLEALCGKDVETKLRNAGFGYRAKYVAESARLLRDDREPEFLSSLREAEYEVARDQLMLLHGVGRKVADCVCLMSLDKHGVVPVDTHVFQFAVRDYMPHLAKRKSVTPPVMKEVAEFFRDLHGPYAGWAQSVLFSGELKKFADRKQQDGVKPVTAATAAAAGKISPKSEPSSSLSSSSPSSGTEPKAKRSPASAKAPAPSSSRTRRKGR